jgi:fermentation-respiration switch protein FrsA (DUF1100 family)
MLRAFEHSQVYHPSREVDYPPEEVGHPWEDVWLSTAEGIRLHGWFFKAAETSARRRLAVLFCHGNGGNISSRPGYYRELMRTGVNLLTFDYRGYGRSEGRVSEDGTYTDAMTALAWLQSRGFPPSHVVAWGESLGGGIASEVARRAPVAGLALQSSFTSIPDLGAELFPWLPVRWIGRIRYDTINRLPRLSCPVLVMHSRADEIIPFHHGERNFAAAREPKLFCEIGGTHVGALEADRAKFSDACQRFMELVEARAQANPAA